MEGMHLDCRACAAEVVDVDGDDPAKSPICDVLDDSGANCHVATSRLTIDKCKKASKMTCLDASGNSFKVLVVTTETVDDDGATCEIELDDVVSCPGCRGSVTLLSRCTAEQGRAEVLEVRAQQRHL